MGNARLPGHVTIVPNKWPQVKLKIARAVPIGSLEVPSPALFLIINLFVNSFKEKQDRGYGGMHERMGLVVAVLTFSQQNNLKTDRGGASCGATPW